MRSIPVLLSACLVAACAGDDGEGPVNCEVMTEDDEFVVGLSKPGEDGNLDFVLTSFSPAPPARLLNEWTLRLMSTGATAAPVAGATLSVTPFMPQHGHGAGIDVEVEPMPTAGEYKLAPINLHMPGLWEVTIEVDAPMQDAVVFKPCIPG